MKVGLLTFHNALNYGAALQVYASQRALDNMGIECQIIDYVNNHREVSYDMWSQAKRDLKKKNAVGALKYCLGSIFMRRRRKEFLKFYDEHLNCTSQRYSSSKEAEALNGEFDKFNLISS